MHLVHNSGINANKIAVIAVLFELQNQTNTKLDNLLIPFKYLSSSKADNLGILQIKKRKKAIIKTINLMEILSINSTNYYFYNGSLTTPPCTEGVNWLILNSSIKISYSQLDIIHNSFSNKNNRIIQKLSNRKILTSDEILCQKLILNFAFKEFKNIHYLSLFALFIFLI